jgi:glycerol dehydrogenase
MALKVMLAPHRYVQGPDALLRIGEQLQMIGIGNPLILASRSAKTAVETRIIEGLVAKDMKYAFIEFGGESTWKEIERVKKACIEGGHDAIISCGGGKTLDTGRTAAAAAAVNVTKMPPEFIPNVGAGVACINIPTVAATDAPTSAASLVYTEQGVVEAILVFASNPAMVFVDTAVIAKSPVRMLVSGMGDALATYFEVDMSYKTQTPCILTGSQSTRTAQALGRLCFDLLMEFGLQAKQEAEVGVPGPGIEAVAEANILLSGLGFESGGLGAAHAVGLSFHNIRQRFEIPQYHGELVAFGTLTQLILENRESSYLDKIFGFCRSVGLPTTFEEMTLKNATEADLKIVADTASKDGLITSMPRASSAPNADGRFYDPVEILNALKATDAYGRGFVRRKGG